MNLLYLGLTIFSVYSRDIYCDEVQITTTPDNPGNVIKNGKYHKDWANIEYISYLNAEKIRFFISGLTKDSNISLLQSDESNDIRKKWLFTELSRHTEKNSEDWVLDVVQECIPRKYWRSIELTLKFEQCAINIDWARNCGNKSRVLSSLNAGFSNKTSELISNGEITDKYKAVSSSKIKNEVNNSWPIYIWTQIPDDNIEISLNVNYSIFNSSSLLVSSDPIIIPFNNSAMFTIAKICSSPGPKKVDIKLVFINLETYYISFGYNCESSVTSYSVFKIITMLVIFSLLFTSLAVVCLRYKHKLTLFSESSNIVSNKKSSYLPDREFPDVQFSDLTFRSDSKAYGTV